jgi:polyisoprenyl-phosphate glycosyltransferase
VSPGSATTQAPQPRGRKLVSLIVPARNEEGNLPCLYDRVSSVFVGLRYDYEVLIVDNASTDRTPELARSMCRRDARWGYIRFSRDFTVEGSLSAGLRSVRGDAAIVLFSDLQDPPECIPEFLARWEEGFDVVYGVVKDRGPEPAWKNWGARAVYRFLGRFANVEIPPGATDFRLLSRRVIDVINQCPERHRYFRGLTHWVGFRSCPLHFARQARRSGKSKASLASVVGLAGDAITAFSLAPLRICTAVGALVGLLLLVWLVLTPIAWMSGWQGFGPGLASALALAQLAATFLCTGILGEYVGRSYWESKQRPLFAIEESINVGQQKAPLELGPEQLVEPNLTVALAASALSPSRRQTGCVGGDHCHAA